MPTLSPSEQAVITRAVALLQSRPKLAEAVIAIHTMIDRMRTCRISLDVIGGRLRIYRDNLEFTLPLDEPPAPASPSG